MLDITKDSLQQLTRFLASEDRYAPPATDESTLVWMEQKDYIEWGFSPEIQAMTDALLDRARSLLRETETPTDRIVGLLREAMWRVAVKFYSQDAWDKADRYIYSQVSAHVPEILAGIELEMLNRMGWRLPFEEAARRIPDVLEDHIRRIDWYLPTAAQFAMTQRLRFHAARRAGGPTAAALEQAAMHATAHHNWLVEIRARRVHELATARADQRGLPMLGCLPPHAQLETPAPVRRVKKRPE